MDITERPPGQGARFFGHGLLNVFTEVQNEAFKRRTVEFGKKIYDGAMTRYEAAAAYGISDDTARDYMHMYRDENGLAPKRGGRSSGNYVCSPRRGEVKPKPGLSDYEDMTKEEFIRELIKARIDEARLKKGYAVKGDGLEKEYIVFGK